MPRPTCQLNLTLNVPVAENVENVAFAANYRPSGAGRVLLEERLALEAAGWKIAAKELGTLLEAVCRLDENGRNAVKDVAEEALLATRDST